jgi:hypothetical protein
LSYLAGKPALTVAGSKGHAMLVSKSVVGAHEAARQKTAESPLSFLSSRRAGQITLPEHAKT